MAVREDEEAAAYITDHNFETGQITRGLGGREDTQRKSLQRGRRWVVCLQWQRAWKGQFI